MKELIIDTREPNKWQHIMKDTFEKRGYSVKFKTLETGDYLTEKTVVERKDIHDLLSSVINKRLDKQINKMVLLSETDGKVPILLVHGNYYNLVKLSNSIKKYPDITIVFGSIASIVTRYNVLFLWIENDYDAAEVLARLVEKIDEEKYLLPRTSDEILLLSRLIKLPVKTTRKLLKATGGSILELINSDVEEYTTVKGIGKIKARKIKEVFEKKLL